MTKPQQPELGRSGHTPADQDHAEEMAVDEVPSGTRPRRPVPEDNQPGHHPEHEQDKPDPERLRDDAER